MCTSKPKAPKPIAMAPTPTPVSVDQEAVVARDDELRRQRLARGRTSTILAGNTGQPPTVSAKTALGM